MLKRFLTLATVMLSLFIGGTTIKADSHGETVTNITVAQYQQNIAKTIPVTPNQVVNKLHAGDTFVLYLGFPGCPYCRRFSPTLAEFMAETNVPVYYLDISQITQQVYQDNNLKDFFTKIDFQGTPTVVLLKHVKRIHSYVGSETPLAALQTLTKYKY